MKISVRSIIRWTLVTCLFTGTFSFIGWAQNPPAAQAAISGVIAAGAKVELVRGGLKGAEGPVAIPDGGLYFSDITANRTYRLDKNGGISVWRENTKGTNGLFLSKDGRLLGAEGGGPRIVAVTPDGRVTALATGFGVISLRSPNHRDLHKFATRH